jgi:hypothetical protein
MSEVRTRECMSALSSVPMRASDRKVCNQTGQVSWALVGAPITVGYFDNDIRYGSPLT